MGSIHTQLLPGGMELEDLWTQHDDKPLVSLAAFDRLTDSIRSRSDIIELVRWCAPQATMEHILTHHGPDGCGRVLEGVARAASKAKVPMNPRVASIAASLGLPCY